MLSRLAFRNAKRSIRDYVIYLITITLSFSLIFAFSLVAGSDAVAELSYGMNTFKIIMQFVNVVIIFVVCFLINYTAKFMFGRRSREFGTYMLLGIRKRDIAKMFLMENVLLGFTALILSIPAGWVASQFLSFVITGIFGIKDLLLIGFDWGAVRLLGIYFAVIYVLVLFSMVRRMRKMTIQGFLYYENRNEKKMLASKKYRALICVLSIIVTAGGLFLWDSRFDFSVSGAEETMYCLMLSILMMIVGIYGIAMTLPDMILSLVLKSKKARYRKDNLFVARTFSSKVRSMSFTMGTLAMLIMLTLVAMNISYITKGMYEYMIDSEAPYDFSVFDDPEVFDDYIAVIEEDYTIDEIFAFDIYKEPKGQFRALIPFDGSDTDFDTVIRERDYNKMRTLRGMDPVDLGRDEYILTVEASAIYLFQNEDSLKEITLADGTRLSQREIESRTYWYSISNEGYFVLVLPDECTEGLEVAESHLIVDTKEETTLALRDKLRERMAWHLVRTDENGDRHEQFYRFQVRGAAREESNTMVAMVSSICLYIAFIFISTVGTILAIQSLSDASKYRYRYTVLSRLGVGDGALHRTILKQLGIFFGLPVVIPVVISFCVLTSINRLYQVILPNGYAYLGYFFSGLAVFLIVYGVYFLAAYVGFKRNVDEGRV